MEALVRTTLTRSFKGDPKALVSLIVIMKQSGYGPDRDEPMADLLSAATMRRFSRITRRNFSQTKRIQRSYVQREFDTNCLID